MKVLFVAAEVAPFAKVGGLADVAGSLPKALSELGHDVKIAMPAYKMVVDDPEFEVVPLVSEFEVEVGPHWTKQATAKKTCHGGVEVLLIGTDEWFDLTVSSQTIYLPGAEQHLFFSRALLDLLQKIDWIPDVIHCNDWHTGMTPVFMRESGDHVWNDTASIYTIHNLAYQGEFGPELLDRVGLSQTLFNMYKLETYGSLNFLKAGCVYADMVNTVSPQYAREIQTPEFGCRLEGLMSYLASNGRLSGILNGIDPDEFNPQTDPSIPAHFDASDLSGKAICREKLLKELGMEPIDGAPVMGVVSRLSSQKGMDIMLEASEELFKSPAQLIVQGLGDPWLAEQFRQLEKAHPDNFRFLERFDADLAQRVYAGCDMFLMPSAFEPCGLGQLIALSYGTIPIVRKTGGLSDTVFEAVNGFVFEEKNRDAFLGACRRAVAAFQRPDWNELVKTALMGDYSWDRSARSYVELYEKALGARSASAVKSA